MLNCQQYIKFLLKKRKKLKIFGDNLPDHITIHSCSFFVVTISILLIQVLPTESVSNRKVFHFSSVNKAKLLDTSHKKQDLKQNCVELCYLMKHNKIQIVMESHDSLISYHRSKFDKNQSQYRKDLTNKCFIYDIRYLDKILKQNLEVHQNHFIEYINGCIHIPKNSFRDYQIILWLLKKCELENLFIQHHKEDGIDFSYNCKQQPFVTKIHHKRMKRSKRSEIVLWPMNQNDETEKEGINSM